MSLTKRVCLFAGAALSMSAAAMAQSSIDESRALTSELLSDAGTRTSALAAAPAYTPRVGGYIQFRYNWNDRDVSVGEDSAVGFQNARTRVNVSGNIFQDNLSYFVQGGWSDESGGFLEDAFGTWKMENGWWVTWGQTKLPVLREENVGDTTQLFAERSALNWTFTQGRSQGVIFGYRAENMQFQGAFSDGANTANTDFTSAAEADYALTGRFDYKFAGAWENFEDFTAFRNQDFAGMAGGALHYQGGGDTFATSDTDVLLATADVGIEGNGWNAYAAGVYRSIDMSGGTDFTDFGFLIQGGIFVAPQVEVVGRIDIVLPDSDRTADDNFTTITGGVNYYVSPDSHAAKLSADLQYFLEQASNSIVPTSTTGGLLGSTDDGEWNFRVQMQLVF
ncbi:MAG: porin [Phycisphaerales bacterium]